MGCGWEEVKGVSKRAPVVNPASTLARDRRTRTDNETLLEFHLYCLGVVLCIYDMEVVLEIACNSCSSGVSIYGL